MDLPKPEMIEPMLRGSRARVLLADPVFCEALTKRRDELIRAWAKSKPHETAEREAAYAEMRAMDEVVRALESFVTDATVEQIRRQKVG